MPIHRGDETAGATTIFPEFHFPQLYVITDVATGAASGGVRTHGEIIRAAVEGGARILQIRDKTSSTRALIETVRRSVAIVEPVNGLLFVNDHVDVALIAGAHGVHLGDVDMPIATARELAGERLLIGASVATVEEALAATRAGADYVSVGAIFATRTKLDAGEPVGCHRITEIKNSIDVPVAAIGGINATNVKPVIRAGADMVCVVSAVTAAEDMERATQRLIDSIMESYDGLGVRV